jgi:hypothetical protein
LAALELDGEVATVILEVREDDDSVQEETAVTMVCITCIFVSCDRGERRLELRCSGDATMDASGMTALGRFWGWRSYQTMQSAEAMAVAK